MPNKSFKIAANKKKWRATPNKEPLGANFTKGQQIKKQGQVIPGAQMESEEE